MEGVELGFRDLCGGTEKTTCVSTNTIIYMYNQNIEYVYFDFNRLQIRDFCFQRLS